MLLRAGGKAGCLATDLPDIRPPPVGFFNAISGIRYRGGNNFRHNRFYPPDIHPLICVSARSRSDGNKPAEYRCGWLAP
jgi:hypothetical protein